MPANDVNTTLGNEDVCDVEEKVNLNPHGAQQSNLAGLGT